jgi:hypothetical protein
MKLPIFAGLALLGAAMATAAHAQLVHISATSDSLSAQFVGYAQALRPIAGTAKFDLYYDASVVGTDGLFTFNDPTKNYWTVSATLGDSTDPNATLYDLRKISSPLGPMRFAPATQDTTPGMFALTSGLEPGYAWFDFGLLPSGPPTALPVPPFTFGQNFNSFYVEFPNHPDQPDDPFDWGSIFGAGLHNFSAEIISPVPEPSIYGIGGAIAALFCIVSNQRRRALRVAAKGKAAERGGAESQNAAISPLAVRV